MRKKGIVIRPVKITDSKKPRKKVKSTSYKPKPFLMVIYWILALLTLLMIYLKLKHFFTTHW
ncbi:MAG: hypothetical protein B7X86_06655 [Sphingobacteriales bacterium 17-39-43]|nr:MAG: hypothetical protein B7Y24_07470 [Sphingobacteriales bacterium 16-39-50]OYZ43358.1 MAG: hypothetical protein B7Y19_09840 [Sphingobacteriales bacterium 24-40-4]OZA25069.1 MAG: hypothetical protein B7X86_06655 [Sphingobacteriales bacterium 17-39-43]OZA60724.1 MAG: hypothetical protein B7X75_03180 [Sphingobacteriales bacterium 39-40-5]